MKDIGEESFIDLKMSSAMCKEAFQALRLLHETGFAHGDPRAHNLIRRSAGGDAFWIDMRDSFGQCQEPWKTLDAEILARSLLRLNMTAPLPLGVSAALASLTTSGAAGLKAKYDLVADQVSKA